MIMLSIIESTRKIFPENSQFRAKIVLPNEFPFHELSTLRTNPFRSIKVRFSPFSHYIPPFSPENLSNCWESELHSTISWLPDYLFNLVFRISRDCHAFCYFFRVRDTATASSYLVMMREFIFSFTWAM